MKVGVCIKYFHNNYGGMLQAYATIKLLDSYGVEYELIEYGKKSDLIGKIKKIPRLLNGILLNDKIEEAKKKIGIILHQEFKKNYDLRIAAFTRFKKKVFDESVALYEDYEGLCKGTSKYDAIITGSDQLWSPAGLPTNFYNLKFVPDEIRKISYASSFGVKEIPWYQIKRTKEFLNRISYISMRENRGAEIVYELTGRKVPVVLDPVFMFDKQEWNELVEPKRLLEEKYIFAYFLGSNQSYRNEVKNLAKTLGYKIVCLRHLDQYVRSDESFGDIALYDVEPSDFLNLLRYAEIVCTDSFHGSVFSIINHKNFIIFNRYKESSKVSKNSRIDTLCNNLFLTERRYDKSISIVEQAKRHIDYYSVDMQLVKMRNESKQYLLQALDLQKN